MKINKTHASARALLCAATMLSGLGWASGAFAQTATTADSDTATLEDVIVTARKTEERLQDVPLTVNALTAHTVEQLQIKSIFDLAQVTPGVYFGTSGGRNGGNKLQIRNFSTGTAGPSKASVFIDGQYFPGDYSSIPLANLERIEVLKGPQSAYFGRATFIGAVNFITRDPTNDFSGNLDFVQATEGEHDYTGYVSIPLIQDVLAAQITFRDYSFAGPDEWRTTDGLHLGGQTTNSISLKTVYTPTDTLKLKFSASHVQDSDEIPPVLYADPTTRTAQARPGGTFGYYFNGPVRLNYAAPAWGQVTTAMTAPGIRHNQDRLAMSYEWEVLGHTISGYASHSQEKYNEQLDGSYYLSGPGTYTVPNAQGVPTVVNYASSPLKFNLSDEDDQFEFRITSPQDQALRYTLGYNYTAVDGHNLLYLLNNTAIYNQNTYGGSFLNPFKDNAIFGGIYFDLNDHITISAEGRYQKETINAKTYSTTSATFGQTLTNVSQEYSAFLPRLNIQYKVNDNLQFYAVYAEGNNPGGFQSTTPALAAANGIAYGYDEEELKNYEAGFKSTLFDGRMTLNAAVYHAKFTNEQLSQTTPIVGSPTGFVSIFLPGVESKLTGFEAELNAAVTSEFQVRGTIGYGKAEYVKFCSTPYSLLTGVQTGLNCRSVAGFQQEGTPALQTSLGGDYYHHLDGDMSVYVRGEWLYQSKVYNEEWDQSWVPAHSTFNARIGLENDRWTLEAFVRNASDDENTTRMTRVTDGRIGNAYLTYPTNGGFSQQGAGQQTVAGTAKKPRQFGLRLGVKF